MRAGSIARWRTDGIPRVGDVVHVDGQRVCHAAIVTNTALAEGKVNLAVFGSFQATEWPTRRLVKISEIHGVRECPYQR
jgi:hypothetical protein